uniref:Uncharacterized protein n=1 Tax=Setaria italica TaxID=4555 RepID=K3YP22_SETIT
MPPPLHKPSFPRRRRALTCSDALLLPRLDAVHALAPPSLPCRPVCPWMCPVRPRASFIFPKIPILAERSVLAGEHPRLCWLRVAGGCSVRQHSAHLPAGKNAFEACCYILFHQRETCKKS